MPQGPGFSLTDHAAVAALAWVALLLAAVVSSRELRRRLRPDRTLALICFSAPFVSVWIAAWSTGHPW